MIGFSGNAQGDGHVRPTVMESFHRALMDWYRAHHRILPWRKTRDPYLIWVSETMLVQTRVATVVDYFNRFIRVFPTISALADADLQEVLKLWEGLGYYSRARNFQKAAKIIVENYGGVVPNDHESFLALPGVGDYIAAAVQSIAFGKPLAVVDGNVKRVLARLWAIDAPVNRSSSYPVFKTIAETVLDANDPGTFNQAMMELGALVCLPDRPRCFDCPVKQWCRASADDRVMDFPVKIKQPPVPHHHLAIGVVVKNGKLLIVLRPEAGLLGGLWEFPGGNLQPEEAPEQACVRIISESTNLQVRVRSFLTRVHHAYTHFKITADVFVCDWEAGRVRLKGPTDYRWVRPEELGRYPFPKSNHKFMDRLLKEMTL